jgi:hypothetical protein
VCLVCILASRTPTINAVATSQTAGTRAKDADRNDTCQILDTALSEGQLSSAGTGGSWGIRIAIMAVLIVLGIGIGYIQLNPDGSVKQVNYP